jgi:hypothetical protein
MNPTQPILERLRQLVYERQALRERGANGYALSVIDYGYGAPPLPYEVTLLDSAGAIVGDVVGWQDWRGVLQLARAVRAGDLSRFAR